MEESFCLQFVEGFPLETELHPPDGLSILPSVERPHVFKPDFARLLEFARLVIDAAGHWPTRREIEARTLQPVGVATHIQIGFLMTTPLARARHKLSQLVHVAHIP